MIFNFPNLLLLNLSKYAINNFSNAIRLQPDNAFFYIHRGIAKTRLGIGEEALEDFDKVDNFLVLWK